MSHLSPPKRVLVVDDEHSIADSLTAILKMRGYEAFAVYSAEEAVLWCRDHQLDVVISDVVMGHMNGLELACHLAAHQPGCMVILISGHALTPTLIRDSAVSYPVKVLAKPIHPQVILDVLATAEPASSVSPRLGPVAGGVSSSPREGC